MPTGFLKKTVTFYLLFVLTLAPATKVHADYDVPADSHMLDLYAEMRHLTDTNDQNFALLWGLLITFISLHTLSHAIGDLRKERYEKLRDAEELRLEIVERKHIEHEIDELTKKLGGLESELATSSLNLRNAINDLKKHANPEADKKLARVLERIVSAVEQKQHEKSPDLFRTVARFASSEQGKKFVATAAGAQWLKSYTDDVATYRKFQGEIFETFHHGQKRYEDFAEKQLGSTTMPRKGEYDAPIHITNEQGVIMNRIPTRGASDILRLQAEMCKETIGRLANEETRLRHEGRKRSWYSSKPNQEFLKPPLYFAAGTGAATAAIYAASAAYNETSPMQHELNRHVNFGVRMNTRMDLLSQIASDNGKKEFQPVFDAFGHALKDNKKELLDAVSESLRKLNMGDQTTMKLGSALENEVNIRSAIQLAIVKATRDAGAYGVNGQQLILLMNTEFKKVPEQWRQSLLGDIIHEAINEIWNVPGADVAQHVPAQVKIALRASLLEHLKHEAEHGHLKVSHPEMVLEMPGVGTISSDDLHGFVGAH